MPDANEFIEKARFTYPNDDYDHSKDPAYEYVGELQSMVSTRYPEAKFKVTGIPDSEEGVAVWAYTDAEDEDINAIVRERELQLLLEKDVYIGVIPMPLEAWRD